MSDFWDELKSVERSRDRRQAEGLLDRMLAAVWTGLSLRDSREFFNELLRLDELFTSILQGRCTLALHKLQGDSRSGHRQDQISKAQILYNLSASASVALLLSIAGDRHQDLDTRTAATRILWKRSDVDSEQAVAAARSLLDELLPDAEKWEDPASAFVVGLCYLLLNFSGRTAADEAMARRVYDLNNPRKTSRTSDDLVAWFRTQFTMGGLAEDAMPRR